MKSVTAIYQGKRCRILRWKPGFRCDLRLPGGACVTVHKSHTRIIRPGPKRKHPYGPTGHTTAWIARKAKLAGVSETDVQAATRTLDALGMLVRVSFRKIPKRKIRPRGYWKRIQLGNDATTYWGEGGMNAEGARVPVRGSNSRKVAIMLVLAMPPQKWWILPDTTKLDGIQKRKLIHTVYAWLNRHGYKAMCKMLAHNKRGVLVRWERKTKETPVSLPVPAPAAAPVETSQPSEPPPLSEAVISPA